MIRGFTETGDVVTNDPGAPSDRPAHGSAEEDLDRANEIFDRLGVKQAVITWSDKAIGEPVFARRPVAAIAQG